MYLIPEDTGIKTIRKRLIVVTLGNGRSVTAMLWWSFIPNIKGALSPEVAGRSAYRGLKYSYNVCSRKSLAPSFHRDTYCT